MAAKRCLDQPLFPSAAAEYSRGASESLFPAGASSSASSGGGSVGLRKCSSYQPPSVPVQGNDGFNVQEVRSDYGKRKHGATSDDTRSSDSDNENSDARRRIKHSKRKADKKSKKEKKRKKWTRHVLPGESDSDNRQERALKELIQLSAKAPRTVWLEDTGLPPELAYRLDDKGDRGNLAYGSIYRMDVARYQRRFSQACLGLPADIQVSLAERSGPSSASKSDVGRYFGKGTLKELRQPAAKKLSSGVAWDGDSPMFLTLEHDEDAEGEVEQSSAGEETSQTLREWNRLTQNYNEKLREQAHNVSLWLEFVAFQDKASSLGDLIDEDAGRDSTSGKSHQKSPTVMARQLRKIAILEQALVHNSSSIELLTCHLRACEDVWDEEKLAQRWKTLLHLHPASLALWRQRLLFVRQRLSRFSFRKASNQYTRCLSQLSSISRGQVKSHVAEPGTSKFLIEVLSAYCDFLHQCGYTERAVSVFQAAVEFNFFMPPSFDRMSCDRQAAFFETFWDSGTARFGENGAKGWWAWMDEQRGETLHEEVVDLPPGLGCATDGKDGAKSQKDERMISEEEEEEKLVCAAVSRSLAFLQLESQREERHWLALKSGEDCDDPDRCVLVDDVSAVLFHVDTEELRLQLVFAFLLFLGVKIPLQCSSSDFALKSTLSHSLVSPAQLSPLLHGMTVVDGCWMLSGSGAFVPLKHGDLSPNDFLSNTQLCSFVDGVFRQVMLRFSVRLQTRLCAVWLCHQAELCGVDLMRASCPSSSRFTKPQRQHVKRLRHWAKALLKLPQNRTNVALWQLFARLEWLSGNIDEARLVLDKILSLTVGLSSAGDDAVTVELCSLYRSFSEMEAGLCYDVSFVTEHYRQVAPSPFDRCLHILNCLATSSSFNRCPKTELSPTQLLRARQGFSSIQEKQFTLLNAMLSSDDKMADISNRAQCLVHIAAMHGLFECLVHGLAAAAAVFNSYVTFLEDICEKHAVYREQCRWACECVLTACVRLVVWYSSHHQATPVNVKVELLERALSLFPDNVEWHLAYSRLHTQSHLTSRLRRFLDQTLLPSSSLTLAYLVAINVENDRRLRLQVGDQPEISVPESGITHRIRSLLERAVSGGSRQQEVSLWRQYAHFELDLQQNSRAWTVYLRAIQACPWAKVIYLDCVAAFPDRLEEMLDILTEKELRIRAPLEEVDILREAVTAPEVGEAKEGTSLEDHTEDVNKDTHQQTR